ncbi:MAG: NUDIX domain-containing protein [Nanohaloarchaea archaeon]|nr:NUDIX domain-containing protein [Candidatus Nanohaloarchaea archaeon]
MPQETREERIRLAEENSDSEVAPRSECCGSNPKMNWSVVVLTYETEEQNNILVQQRSDDKDRKPGYHELTAGHVVDSDRKLEDAAVREYAEELHDTYPEQIGLSTDDFKYLGTLEKESEDNPEMLAVYTTTRDSLGEAADYAPGLSNEVESVWFEPVNRVLERKDEARPYEFTDSAKQVLEMVYEQ